MMYDYDRRKVASALTWKHEKKVEQPYISVDWNNNGVKVERQPVYLIDRANIPGDAFKRFYQIKSEYDAKVPGDKPDTWTVSIKNTRNYTEGYVAANGKEYRTSGKRTWLKSLEEAKRAAELHYEASQAKPELDPAVLAKKLTKAQKEFIQLAVGNGGRLGDWGSSADRTYRTNMLRRLQPIGIFKPFGSGELTELGWEVAKLIR